MEDNEIKQEFKAYLLTQDDIRTFIQENFERQNIENLSDKIQDYYNFAKENNKISFKEATEIFSLSRSEWDKFIKQLEENHEIERLANNSIIWKKNNF